LLFLNIIDVDSIQQDYIINSKKIKIFATILQLLLLITKLLFNREIKEEKKKKRKKVFNCYLQFLDFCFQKQ